MNQYAQHSRRHNSTAFYGLLSLAVLGLLISGCAGESTTVDDDATSSSVSSEAALSMPVIPAASSSSETAAVIGKKYADGTYSAVGNYKSPAGPETVDISITLKNGVIADATFKGEATVGKSQNYQKLFSEGFREQVVGKSIAGLSLGAVNGSSLTPIGFMDAVSKIEAQAQG